MPARSQPHKYSGSQAVLAIAHRARCSRFSDAAAFTRMPPAGRRPIKRDTQTIPWASDAIMKFRLDFHICWPTLSRREQDCEAGGVFPPSKSSPRSCFSLFTCGSGDGGLSGTRLVCDSAGRLIAASAWTDSQEFSRRVCQDRVSVHPRQAAA